MKKIAFIDLEFHKKTKSSIFFQDILKKTYDIDFFNENEVSKCLKNNYEKYIYWQVIPDFLDLIKIKDKQIIFIPMYDWLALNKIARERYKCFNIRIICFCKKVYNFFSRMWFDCFYIQYFLPPLEYNIDYSNKNIFFRYRWDITRKNVKTIIWNQNVTITIKDNPDPWYKSLKIPENDIIKYNVSFQNEFFKRKEDYLNILSKHSIFIAPRKQEWIWMSFLESMNLWQCVIAYNDSTMNEYIINNKNWILTEFNKEINLDNYSEIWRNTKLGYNIWFNKWDTDILKCMDFIKEEFHVKQKKITFLDYIVDLLIKIRRRCLKIKKEIKRNIT